MNHVSCTWLYRSEQETGFMSDFDRAAVWVRSHVLAVRGRLDTELRNRSEWIKRLSQASKQLRGNEQDRCGADCNRGVIATESIMNKIFYTWFGLSISENF